MLKNSHQGGITLYRYRELCSLYDSTRWPKYLKFTTYYNYHKVFISLELTPDRTERSRYENGEILGLKSFRQLFTMDIHESRVL